jgi:hypothetical protein
MPTKPGGRHPPFAHALHTTYCLRRPSSMPASETALSVETGLLHATQVATSALFSFALLLGIAAAPVFCRCHLQTSIHGLGREHDSRVFAEQFALPRRS